ncbi:MAG: hypothetical protein ACEQSX_19070 [Baekduiaceae bacterium]
MLNAAWQIFALTLIVAAFAVVLWDAHLRGERTRTGRALGGALIATVLVGAWVLAEGSAWGWAIVLVGGALVESIRRATAVRASV